MSSAELFLREQKWLFFPSLVRTNFLQSVEQQLSHLCGFIPLHQEKHGKCQSFLRQLPSPQFVHIWLVPEHSKHAPTFQKLVGTFPRAAWRLFFFCLLFWHEELLIAILQRGRVFHAYCKGKKCIRNGGQLILNTF